MWIRICSNEGPCPFPRGDNYELAKIHWRNLKIFISRTARPISTKLGTKHPWVMGIQFYSNEGPRPFPRGDNYKIAKIHWHKSRFVRATRETSKFPKWSPFIIISRHDMAKILPIWCKTPYNQSINVLINDMI